MEVNEESLWLGEEEVLYRLEVEVRRGVAFVRSERKEDVRERLVMRGRQGVRERWEV
jgi:hypothetical protein